MFEAGAPTWTIDLGRDEGQRWAEVISHERSVAGRLVQEAATEIERVPELVRWVFARLYQRSGGLYQREIEAWAEGMGVSVGTATMLNCAYELSHLRWPRPLGCTTGVLRAEGLGMVHVRNLDWPLPGMGDATRLFRFRKGSREFVSVGVPGQVGVLSGMVPGAYSATINWAPPGPMPTFEFGPTFLLRRTLETCDSYEMAVLALTQTPLSAGVFFTLCGAENGQACVIERTQRSSAARQWSQSALVQANHHVSGSFASLNGTLDEVAAEGEEEFTLDGCRRRHDVLRRTLDGGATPRSLDEAAAALDVAPVLNALTCQKMVFCPRTGEVRVWRRLGA